MSRAIIKMKKFLVNWMGEVGILYGKIYNKVWV